MTIAIDECKLQNAKCKVKSGQHPPFCTLHLSFSPPHPVTPSPRHPSPPHPVTPSPSHPSPPHPVTPSPHSRQLDDMSPAASLCWIFPWPASIEYIEKIIATYGVATEANRAYARTGGQRHPPRPRSGRRRDAYRRPARPSPELQSDSPHPPLGFPSPPAPDAARSLPRGPTYPRNGGCMSHAMLEDIARLKSQYPDRVHFLLGNHELAELTDYPIQKNRQMLNLLFRLGLQQMYGPAADRVREAMLAFLRTCPLAVWMPGRRACLSTASPKVDSRPSTGRSSTGRWTAGVLRAGRRLRLALGPRLPPGERPGLRPAHGGAVLINGHEPCPEGFAVPNRPGHPGLLRRQGRYVILSRTAPGPGGDRRADQTAGGEMKGAATGYMPPAARIRRYPGPGFVPFGDVSATWCPASTATTPSPVEEVALTPVTCLSSVFSHSGLPHAFTLRRRVVRMAYQWQA